MGTANVGGKQYRSGKLPSGQKYEVRKDNNTTASSVKSGNRETIRLKHNHKVATVLRKGTTPGGKPYSIFKSNVNSPSKTSKIESDSNSNRKNIKNSEGKMRMVSREGRTESGLDYQSDRHIKRGKTTKTDSVMYAGSQKDGISMHSERKAKKDGKLGVKRKTVTNFYRDHKGYDRESSGRVKSFKDV